MRTPTLQMAKQDDLQGTPVGVRIKECHCFLWQSAGSDMWEKLYE